MDVISYVMAKKYTNKVGSTINGTSYDYNTGELTFNTVDGDWTVPVNNGMNATYKQTLDNVAYDNTTSTLQVNGVEVLTKENVENENIDFSNMF